GQIKNLDDRFLIGYINSPSSDKLVQFLFDEVIQTNVELRIGTFVQFTLNHKDTCTYATRIKICSSDVTNSRSIIQHNGIIIREAKNGWKRILI
ncbi:hypothetical protein SNEBB_008868, partial [Seison nebaliae]